MSTNTVNVAELDFTDEAAIADLYRSSDLSGKSAIRSAITARRDSLIGMGTSGAMAPDEVFAEYGRLNELLDSIKGSSVKTDIPVDYNQIVAEHLFVLNRATEYILRGQYELPEGVEVDGSVVTDKLRELSESDIPAELLKRAEALAAVKFGRKGHTGPRKANGSIPAHVDEWLDQAESGDTVTMAELASFPSETYGDKAPSQGALAAYLFPRNGDSPEIDGCEIIPAAFPDPRRIAKV